MCFFRYIVYQLLVGLSNATNQEASDPVSKGKNKDKDKDELVTNSLLSLHCLPASRRPFKCTLDATTLDAQKSESKDSQKSENYTDAQKSENKDKDELAWQRLWGSSQPT